MKKLLLLTTSICVSLFTASNASAEDINQLKAQLQQDQMQYTQLQNAIKPAEEQINALNQNIAADEKPLQEKYQGLDQTLQNIDKPYQDQISRLNQQMQQADQPYRDQIRQRDEEQRRVDRETHDYRDQIRQINDSIREQRRQLDDLSHRLERDRAAIHNYESATQINKKK